MNTTQLECFLAVANFLNFSRAAEQLRITQPAVSHQISSLEDELGTKLFFRTSKSVRLTQAGHLFTQYANEILKLSGLSRARLKECQETLPQRFGIGCRNLIELRLLRPVLAQLGQQQPRLLPVLRLLPYASLENLLAEDDVQVLLSLQESAPSKAVYQELARCPLVCICTPDHPLAAYDQLTIEQVKNGGGSPPVRRPSIRRHCFPCKTRWWPNGTRIRCFSATIWKSSTLWWRPAMPLPLCRTCRRPGSPGFVTFRSLHFPPSPLALSTAKTAAMPHCVCFCPLWNL